MAQQEEDKVGELILRIPVYGKDKMTFSHFCKKKLGYACYFSTTEVNDDGPKEDVKGYRIRVIGGHAFISEKAIEDAALRGDFNIEINLD